MLCAFVLYTIYRMLGGTEKPYIELAGFCFVGISFLLSYFFRTQSRYFWIMHFITSEIAVPNGKYNNFVWGPLVILFGIFVFLSKSG